MRISRSSPGCEGRSLQMVTPTSASFAGEGFAAGGAGGAEPGFDAGRCRRNWVFQSCRVWSSGGGICAACCAHTRPAETHSSAPAMHCALRGGHRVAGENQRHAVAGGQADELAGVLRLAIGGGARNDLLQPAEQLRLVVHGQQRVSDNVHEQHVGDFQFRRSGGRSAGGGHGGLPIGSALGVRHGHGLTHTAACISAKVPPHAPAGSLPALPEAGPGDGWFDHISICPLEQGAVSMAGPECDPAGILSPAIAPVERQRSCRDIINGLAGCGSGAAGGGAAARAKPPLREDRSSAILEETTSRSAREGTHNE